jgi:hypothetical protein
VGLLLIAICTNAVHEPAYNNYCGSWSKQIETPDVSNVLYWKGEMAQSICVAAAVRS